MILKASQRSGAVALANHLLNERDNEHVEVHEVRGFVAEDVRSAMKEAQALAMGTRCKQPLFSVSLSPPETAAAGLAAFERAIDKIEERCGLVGQPRIVIFHEKEGRRHAHAVWSRVDAESMTAVALPFFKLKLREVSRELYFEHGWKMPKGLMNSKERDPRNFDLAEWQQAKRIGRDPRELKGIIQDCWSTSDSRAAFAASLESRGLYLARGDRRGVVAVPYEGEVLSIARVTGRPAKEIRARLGSETELPSVAETRERIASVIAPRVQRMIDRADEYRAREMDRLNAARRKLASEHRLERAKMDKGQQDRRERETRERASRLRRGISGLWDRITGEHSKMRRLNESEAFASFHRDRAQRDALIVAQLFERRGLQEEIRLCRQRYTVAVAQLHRDLARLKERDTNRNTFERVAREKPKILPRERSRGRDERGFDR